MCNEHRVSLELVRQWLQPQGVAAEERVVVLQPAAPLGGPVGRTLAEVECELIERTLVHCGGNRMRTAEKLGMQRSHLYKKLDRYRIRD